jgi:iron complex outermembrane receptor protein
MPALMAMSLCGGVTAAEKPARSGGGTQPPEPDTVRMEEVEVVGEQEETQDIGEMFDLEEIERLQTSNTAEGLLENTTGVNLRRQRFSGNENGRLRIRGFDESRSRILLNGRNLHGSGVFGGYYVDWDSLSLSDVERVELIRGAGPAKYGNNLGGVLNVVTKRGSADPRTVLSLRGGLIDEDAREDMWSGQVSHLGGYGPLLYSFSYGHHDSDGYLRNAYSDRELVSGSITYLITEQLDFTLAGRYNNNESGMIIRNQPGDPFFDPNEPVSLGGFLGGPGLPFKGGNFAAGDDSHWRDERINLDASLSYETDPFSFDLRAFYMDQSRKERFFSISEPGELIFAREAVPEKDNWGWRTDFEHMLADGAHTIEYGAQGTYLGYGDIDVKMFDADYFIDPRGPLPPNPHPNLTDTEGKDTITEWEGGYVQDTWKVTEWLDLKPGIRFDQFSAEPAATGQVEMEESKLSPRLAATVYPWQGGHVTGRYARAYRFPTIPEYYWWNAGFQPPGRKDLAPEKADQFELEVGHEFSTGTRLTVRGYYYDVEDYIRTIFGYRPSRVIYNIDSVEFRGIEIEVSHRLPHNFRIWGNYTFQNTDKHGDVLDSSARLTDELVELPENTLNLGLAYEKPDGLQAGLTLRYVDSRREIRGDLASPGGSFLEGMDQFVDLDFNMSYPVFQGKNDREVRWELTLDNILDQHYEEEFGYPHPGMTLLTGVRITF